jgi:enolase
MSGSEVVDLLLSLWHDSEIISMEDPLAANDTESLKLLLSKLREAVREAKQSSDNKLTYCVGSGVGGDSQVNLQIVADADYLLSQSDEEDVELARENPFNAVKIKLSSIHTVSAALSVCKKAKKRNWAVIISSNDDSLVPESTETFICDFAVGVGAGQLLGGGLQSGEFYCKYNRILEIIAESPYIPFVGSKFRTGGK